MTRGTRDVLWVGSAAVVLVGVDLGRRILATNDEARFPMLAQDILARGAWLTPHLVGEPYLNKPPLLAWLIAALSWPAGEVSQLTAVIPTAAAAIGAAFVVLALGRELLGERVGRAAALAALTTQGFVEFSRVPVPDMLMTAGIAASVWVFARQVRQPERRWWIGAYGFTAAAFWAKGPAGLLPLAIVLAWALLGDRPGRWRALRLGPGLGLVVLLVAPFWIVGLLTSAAGVRRAAVTDQLLWYAPGSPSATTLLAPLRNAAGIVLPWVVLVPLVLAAAIRGARAGGEARNALRLLLAWAGVTFLLVALSREQRFRYYLPLVPPLALLVGWWVTALAARYRSAARGVTAVWTVSGLGLLLVYHIVMGRQNVAYDYPSFRETLRPALSAGPPVVAWDVYHLPLAFYLGRPVAPIGSEAELRRVLESPRPAIAIVRDDRLTQVVDRERFAVLARGRLGGRSVSVVGAAP